ncbi:N-acyl homoserine lactonase family protein [bacterium]|nr:MAG: N-acyl homoserine lactonase family protein [bacterium]
MEIFACIVGRSQRQRHYMFHLAHGDDVTLVYPFWVAVGASRKPILIDTGFAADVAHAHGVTSYADPGDLLKLLGFAPADVETIVISHLHYDHFGVPERFPNAAFAVQHEDVDYYTKRGLNHPARALADAKSLDALADLRSAGRLRVLHGDTTIAPELRVVHVGGHTPGMQIVVCESGAGRVVLACDASHFYENLETHTPTALIHNYEDYERGFDTISQLAATGTWLPGHDPHMLDRLERVEQNVYRVPKRS